MPDAPPGRYTYAWPRAMVTVDAVVFCEGARVLLIERANDPFAGTWALPGGFIEMDETLEASAARELEEETGLRGVSLRAFGTFGDPGRDPRGRSITVAYWGRVEGAPPEVSGRDDARDARWWPLDALPALAFDHRAIITEAWAAARGSAVDE